MQTADLDSMALFVARLLCSRLEVELTFTLLIKDAIGSRTTATHVHPVPWHDHNRAGTEIFGRGRVAPRIPDSADNYVLDLAAVRVKRVVSSCGNLAYLRVLSNLWVAGQHRELHPLPLGQLDPLQLRKRNHQRCLAL